MCSRVPSANRRRLTAMVAPTRARRVSRRPGGLLMITALFCAGMISFSARASPSEQASAVHLALGTTRDRLQRVWPVAPHASLRIHQYGRMTDALEQLYRRHEYQPFWTRDGAPSRQARALVALLQTAADFGLEPQDYAAGTLGGMLSDLSSSNRLTRSAVLGSAAPAWALFDVTLSDALLAFVCDVHAGRIDPRSVGFDLAGTNNSFPAAQLVATLASSSQPETLIGQVEPQFIHYRLLKQALRQYRMLATVPGLTDLPPLPAAVIGAGAAYDGAPALRRLLSRLGCLQVNAVSAQTYLDPALIAALRQFQWQHGLAADGRLGRKTYAALTTPIPVRIRQIELTLERWRWLPALTGRTIIVNIPQYRLFGFAHAQDRELNMLRMDVVVGEEYPRKRTPILAADMRSVIFRP